MDDSEVPNGVGLSIADPYDFGTQSLLASLSRLSQSTLAVSAVLITAWEPGEEPFEEAAGCERLKRGAASQFVEQTIASSAAFHMLARLDTDSSFAANPVVVGPSAFRSYAGVRLHNGGRLVGVLSLFDTAADLSFDQSRQSILRMIVDQIEAGLALRSELATLQARDRNLRLAERKMALAEELAGVGHWSLDVDSAEVTWSDQVYRIHGVDPSSFDPQLDGALAFYEEDSRQLVSDHVARAVMTGQGYAFKARLRRATDGAVRTVMCRAEPSRHPVNGGTTLFGVFQDVTDQDRLLQQVVQERERYKLLTQNATDVIATYRQDATFTYLSPAIFSLLGRAPEDLIGRKAFEIIHPDDHLRVREGFQSLLASRAASSRIEYRAIRADGGTVWVEAHPSPVYDAGGALTGFQDVVRDVSARKALEDDLNAARIAAEVAAQAKSDFLANMSHELRTPLTAIIGFGGLMAEDSGLTPRTKRHLERVRSASTALLSTVNDVLDFSKLEAGQVEIRLWPTDPGELLADVVGLLGGQAAAKEIALDMDGMPELPALLEIDGDRIRQVLTNLVGNAVKFTSRGGVRLSALYTDGVLGIEVTDTGPGIPPEGLCVLFQRFSQVDGSSTRNHGGTGLGLAISKGLIEAMGGEIGVRSQVGQGSTFFVRIPASTTEAPALIDCAPAAEAGLRQDVRILVVDDNAANRELVSIILRPLGWHVSTASDGEQALIAANTDPFDVILLDRHMPRLDGEEVARRIRREGGLNSEALLLAFTADVLVDAGVSFDGMVAKPVSPADLIDTLARAPRHRPGRQAQA